jgi:hypothetical protein
MKFYPKSPAAAERLAEHIENHRNRTYMCSRCDSPDTVELDEMTPSGFHHKVRCPQGHVTNGRPAV